MKTSINIGTSKTEVFHADREKYAKKKCYHWWYHPKKFRSTLCPVLSSSVLDSHYLNSFNEGDNVLPDLWISLAHGKLGQEISVVCSHILRASWSKSKTSCSDSIEQTYQSLRRRSSCSMGKGCSVSQGGWGGLCWHPVSEEISFREVETPVKTKLPLCVWYSYIFSQDRLWCLFLYFKVSPISLLPNQLLVTWRSLISLRWDTCFLTKPFQHSRVEEDPLMTT